MAFPAQEITLAHEEALVLGSVGRMALRALARLHWAMNRCKEERRLLVTDKTHIGCALDKQVLVVRTVGRMAYRAEPYAHGGMDGGTVEILFLVAIPAKLRRRGLQKFLVVRLVGLVAALTAHHNRRMYSGLREHISAVTGLANIFALQQLVVIAGMRIMAARAHASGYRHMDDALAREHPLVVAHETQVRLRGREAFGNS
jgi:hypothetical protein